MREQKKKNALRRVITRRMTKVEAAELACVPVGTAQKMLKELVTDGILTWEPNVQPNRPGHYSPTGTPQIVEPPRPLPTADPLPEISLAWMVSQQIRRAS